METIPKRKLRPSPITAVSFGLAIAIYLVFVAYVANMPPLPHKTEFVDNDVATRLVRALYRVNERQVDTVCIVDVELGTGTGGTTAIDQAKLDPEVALQDFAGILQPSFASNACLEGGLGDLP